MNLTGVECAKPRTPEGATTSNNARPRRSTCGLLVAAGLFYFWLRRQTGGLGYGTPDKRYEHSLLRALATREPPNSGKMSLTQ